jgi:hypothetical protein
MKRIIYSFFAGFAVGALIGGIIFEPEKTKSVTDILQTVVIITATIFTAWWTSKTFGHELRSKEAKSIIEDLQKIQNILPDIAHPKPDIEDLKDINMSMNNMELKLEQLTAKAQHIAFNEFLIQREMLMQKAYTSMTLKAFTQSRVISLLSTYGSKEKILNDKEKNFMKEIIFLQGDIAREAYFDIGQEITILRNKIGI